MNQNIIQSILAKFLPILLIMAILLISSGFVLMIYFANSIYQIFAQPDQSLFLNLILDHLPGPIDETYRLSLVIDGKDTVMDIPSSFLQYGRYLLAFMIWGMLGGLITYLFSCGLNVLRLFLDGRKFAKDSKNEPPSRTI